MTTHDRAVLGLIRADAEREGIGLREYCRRYGIRYTSLGGRDVDLDAAAREADIEAIDTKDDGQGKLERHMLGEWADGAYRSHLAALRADREAEPAE